MNRREFFKGAAALAAAAPFARGAFAHEVKPKAGNNPIWLMTSAFASDPDFESVVRRAKSVGAQGLELCVFRRDTDRQDHIATHLDYDNFTPERAKKVIEICNREGIRISVGAYDNLIGGNPDLQVVNQNHILKLVRIAAMLGGDANDVVCGTFVGYDHILGRTDRGFEKTLAEYVHRGGRVIRIGADEVPYGGTKAISEYQNGRRRDPAVVRVFDALQDEFCPVRVSGDCLYGLNRTPTGWLVWLFNNRGITHYSGEEPIVDPAAKAGVSVTFKARPKRIADVRTGAELGVAENVRLAVEPGAWRILEAAE